MSGVSKDTGLLSWVQVWIEQDALIEEEMAHGKQVLVWMALSLHWLVHKR